MPQLHVQDIVTAPVVGDDPNSAEAKLARQAKTIQAQAATDSAYDTVIERFSDSTSHTELRISPVSIVLLVLCVGFGYMAVFKMKRLKK